MAPRTSLLVLPLALLIGCTGDIGGAGSGDGDSAAAGRYDVTSTYDLTGAPGIPDQIDDALKALTGLSDDPAGTLIALLQAADIPEVNTLLDAIPGALLDSFKGWVNDYIAQQLYNDVPVTQQISTWADDLATALTSFDIITSLDLGPASGDGSASGDHMLSAVAFQLEGQKQNVDTPDIVDTITVARDVACDVTLDAQDLAGSISIGDHSFHLPLGNFLVIGFDQMLQAELGVANVRDALGMLVDCGGLADNVSSKCAGPVCVGHRDEIAAFCEAGLDQVAQQIEAKLSAIDYAALHLASGEASLHDAGKADGVLDGRIDLMDTGSWQAGLDVNGTEVPVGASFSGTRSAE